MDVEKIAVAFILVTGLVGVVGAVFDHRRLRLSPWALPLAVAGGAGMGLLGGAASIALLYGAFKAVTFILA